MMDSNQKYKTGVLRFCAAFFDGLILIPLTLLDGYAHNHIENSFGVLVWIVIMASVTLFYTVFMHYKYGQTFGKMLTKIKVVDVGEDSNLTLKQALLRDSFFIVFESALIFFVAFKLFSTNNTASEVLTRFNDFGGFFGFFWVLLELGSMLTNRKRRAIHDFLAGSVVIRTDIHQ